MLIEFSVGNYRSFHQPVTLSMQAASLRHKGEIDRQNVFLAGKFRLLRSAAIYGANASGKSNLVRAMMFMRRFVLDSSTKLQAGDPIDVQRFAFNMSARQEPAYFQIIFLLDGKRYRYGFEVDEKRVHAEWLYRTRQRETRLFVREGEVFDISGPFRKETTGLESRTRDNALFLSTLAQFNSPTAIALLDWFRSRFQGISGLDDTFYGTYTMHRFEAEENFRQRVRELIRLADVGISDLTIKNVPFNSPALPEELRNVLETIAQQEGKPASEFLLPRIQTFHPLFKGETQISQESLDMDEESEGTQKFFYLLGPLLDTLEDGITLVTDELEARLHPLLTREIVRMFNSPQSNPRNAQLIFATHDAGLLGECMLRRDQIWFTEKNRYGATDLYSLAEMKERHDASFDKNYLAGRYGAIPFLGGLRPFLEQEMQRGEKTEAERSKTS
ncbi:MAG: ATP-binding protein [Caldilineae bacterium]|nr:MAG: ATP-binding protein [Caldilineae bacterium]